MATKRNKRHGWINTLRLPVCPVCGEPWTWIRVEAQGGGDPNAEVTMRYDMAECEGCGVRVEIDQPLEPENEE